MDKTYRRTVIDVTISGSIQSVLLRYNAASDDNRIRDKQNPQLATVHT